MAVLKIRESSLSLLVRRKANEYAIRRVEFLGNATTRHNVLARRVFLVEGDIFTRKVLERSIRSLSKLKIIKPVQLSDVEVKLDREHKVIDFPICVQEKRRSR